MSCPVCGNNNLTKDTPICPICGTPNPEYAAPQYQQQAPQQPPKKTNKALVGGVIAAAIVLIIGTILFFALRDKDDDGKLTADQNTTEAVTEAPKPETETETATEDKTEAQKTVEGSATLASMSYEKRPSIINDNLDYTYEDFDQDYKAGKLPVSELHSISMLFTDDQLREIATALGIPRDLKVSVAVGNSYWWDGAGMELAQVDFYHNGTYCAGAECQVHTSNVAKSIYSYEP